MNDYGQAPTDGVAGDFVAIAAGDNHSMALRRDGSIQCWGFNGNGQAPPGGVVGKFSVEFSSVIESG
ncbi:PPIase cyclophilin-type domain-containing protein [Pycnococcus provasolii]